MSKGQRLIDASGFEALTVRVPEGMEPKSFIAGMQEVIKKIDAQPTADAEPVVHAKYENHQCTACGAEAPTDSRLDFIAEEDISFCYNCGAIMDEEPQIDPMESGGITEVLISARWPNNKSSGEGEHNEDP